jgi:hypothetical protein
MIENYKIFVYFRQDLLDYQDFVFVISHFPDETEKTNPLTRRERCGPDGVMSASLPQVSEKKLLAIGDII